MDEFFFARVNRNEIETRGIFQASLGNKACGVFAEWNWDGKKLLVTNDRYGYYPIYYYCSENEFAVSPSIQMLLEFDKLKEFDDDALAVMLRLGWSIGNETIFRSIRSVPPGSTLFWQNGELTIESKGIIQARQIEISRTEAIEKYAELFQRSVESTAPEKFVVPLSGGRDSRHILFALCKAELKPEACLTVLHRSPSANEDARIAGEICKRLNLEHRLIEPRISRFDAEVEKNKLSGYSVYEHGWFLPLKEAVKNPEIGIYDGIAGDVLSAGHLLDEERLNLYRMERYEELAENILGPEDYIPAILTEDSKTRFSRKKAINRMVDELMKHACQPNPVGSFYLWNRTRRCIALSPFRLLGNSNNIITPYMESSLWDFLMSLPAEFFLDHRFHSETIAFAYPDLADIPYEIKSEAPTPDFEEFQRFSRDIFSYSLTGKKRHLTRRSFIISRYLRAAVQKRYSRAFVDFGSQAIHLLQLERL